MSSNQRLHRAALLVAAVIGSAPLAIADAPTPPPISNLIFVIEPNETQPITRLREATIARYTANGLHITTVARADIDKWIAENAPKTTAAADDFGLVLYAQSTNADAIAGICEVRPREGMKTHDSLANPWLINLRRASSPVFMRVESVSDNPTPIELLDSFDAHRPVNGQTAPAEANDNVSALVSASRVPIRKDLQPRDSFVIYSDYFPDEPLPRIDRIRPDNNPDRAFIGIMFDSAKRGENDARPRVVSVIPGSPAELGGLQPGDMLLAVNGAPTSTVESLANFVGNSPLGQPLNFEVERRGESAIVQVRPSTVRACSDSADRIERDQIESIINMLATGGALKDSNGPAAPIRDLNKRLAVIQFIRPDSGEDDIPVWARSPDRPQFSPMLGAAAPILQMLEHNGPQRITWITITIGGDEARWHDWISAAAYPGLQLHYQDPPNETKRLVRIMDLFGDPLLIVRNGKLVRKTDAASLPLVLKRLTSSGPSSMD